MTNPNKNDLPQWARVFLWHSERYGMLLSRCQAILRKAGIDEQFIGNDLETIESQAGLTGREFAEQQDFEAALSAWALNRAADLAAIRPAPEAPAPPAAAEQVETLSEAGDTVPDGPTHRGEFHYKGKTATGIERKPWLLLRLVWNNHPDPVDLAEVGEQVWDDDVIREGRVRTAASKVSRALLEAEIPMEMHVVNERASLEIKG